MSNEYVDSLLKVVGIVKYNGRLIYCDKGKFYVNGNTNSKKEFKNLFEAKQFIDCGIKDFRKLIRKQYEQQQRLREEAENNSDE